MHWVEAFEQRLGRPTPLPAAIPRGWGWVAAMQERSDADSATIRFELVPRVPLSPTGTAELRYLMSDSSSPADDPAWRRGISHRATAQRDRLRVTCEISELPAQPLAKFLAAVDGQSLWTVTQRPPAPPGGGASTDVGFQGQSRAARMEERFETELPSVIQDIETKYLAELPSVTRWPVHLGVLAETTFDTGDGRSVYHSASEEIVMAAVFRTAGSATDVRFRLSRQRFTGSVEVGSWHLAFMGGSVSDADVVELIGALRESLV